LISQALQYEIAFKKLLILLSKRAN